MGWRSVRIDSGKRRKRITILSSRMVVTLAIPDQTLRTIGNTTAGDKSDGTPLELTKVAMVNATISGHAGGMTREDRVWSGLLQVPTHLVYTVPVPSPAIFGKTAFGITLSDAGAITSL